MYTTHEHLIAAHVAEPMYIGGYSALSHHGLTEQVPLTVYVRHQPGLQSWRFTAPLMASRRSVKAGTTPTSIEGTNHPGRADFGRRPSSIVLTIRVLVAASASCGTQCAPPTNKAVPETSGEYPSARQRRRD